MKFRKWVKYILFSAVLLPFSIFAQEERDFRDLYSKKAKEVIKKNKRVLEKSLERVYQRKISPMYRIDLNQDDRKEQIVFEKNNGLDYMHVYNYKSEKVFSYKFQATGIGSKVYKMNLRKLSSETNLLVIYYYEGVIDYLDLESTVRGYFLTIDNKDLNTMSVFRGPELWKEGRERRSNHYYRREYKEETVDLNKDGYREMLFKFRDISKAYMYKGKGQWTII